MKNYIWPTVCMFCALVLLGQLVYYIKTDHVLFTQAQVVTAGSLLPDHTYNLQIPPGVDHLVISTYSAGGTGP